MANSSSIDKRKNKSLVINNKFVLKQYALKNYEIFGQGIIVINLLLLKTDILDNKELVYYESGDEQEPTIHYPVSYIPRANFWFKMLSLKIKKKYKIDIQLENNIDNKFLVVFIKDASIEYFSIYSLKLDSKKILND